MSKKSNKKQDLGFTFLDTKTVILLSIIFSFILLISIWFVNIPLTVGILKAFVSYLLLVIVIVLCVIYKEMLKK